MKEHTENLPSETLPSHDQDDIVMMVASDLLDCPLCNEPLQPPITQCANGHHACGSCVDKVVECPSCRLSSDRIRNLAFEAFVDGARVRCSYWDWGCRATLCYYEKLAHESYCSCSPCFCPIPGCVFRCVDRDLASHVKGTHRASAVFYKIFSTRETKVPLRPEDSFVVLDTSESIDYVHLLVKGDKREGSMGCSLAVVCLQSGSSKSSEYEYMLSVTGNGCNLKLTSRPAKMTRWSGGVLGGENHLFVPDVVADSNRLVEAKLRLQKPSGSTFKK